VTASLVDPGSYNGKAFCGWSGCENPARWMPVLVFVAQGHAENRSTRVPTGLLSLGVCDACRETVAADLAANVAPDVRDRVLNRSLRTARLCEVRFDRVEWVEIARAA
jgi:hypothetical protein